MGAPVHFPEANFVLGPPGGWEDAVVPLPVRRQVGGQLVSCWELSVDEIAEISRTGKIWLSVWGGVSQPPVYVTALKDEVLPAQA